MKNKGILIICLIFCQSTAFCQQALTSAFGMSEGLSSPKTERLFQSSNGFIWIGTSLGVSNFDGYRFVNFKSANGGPIGSVNAIVEGRDGTIWIGSTEGLFYIKYKMVYSTPWSRNNDDQNSIQDIRFDQEDNLWVCSGRGPYLIAKQQLRKAIDDPECCPQIKTLPAWVDLNLDDNRSNRIAMDTTGAVYIANNFYVFKYFNNNLEQWFKSPDGEVSKISSILVEHPESVWWTASESRVYSRQKGKSEIAFPEIYFPRKIIRDDDGLLILTPDVLYRHHDNKITTLYKFSDHNVTYPRDLIVDIEGNIWVASWSGLIKVKISPFVEIDQEEHPASKEIYAIYPAGQDELLLGANQGVVLKLIHTGETSQVQELAKVVTRSEISDFIKDINDDLWIASNYQGLIRKEDDTYINYTKTDGLADNGFHCLFKTEGNQLWAGSDGGITRIDVTPDKLVSFKNYTHPMTDATYLQVQFGFKGPDDRLWVGTNLGMYNLMHDSLTPYPLFNDGIPFIHDGIITVDDDVWLATSTQGLVRCHFSMDGNLVINKELSDKNELFSKAYLDILVDQEDRMWVASYDEICLVQNHKQIDQTKIICFNKNDGYPLSGYHSLKMNQDGKGNIWLASTRGMAYFNPDDIDLNLVPPYTHLHDILIDGEKVDLGPFAANINQRTGLPDQLRLPYHKNYLSFDFSGISFSNSAKNTYQYKLDGVDKSWQSSLQNKIISYPNLPPGKFSFKVRAANNHGIWNERPERLKFEISPPFWKTWWFVLTSVLLVFLSIIFYYKRREDRLRKTESEKNRVNNLIAELKIKAIRAQMNPHFIFNCLNSIQACIVEQKHEVATHYLSKFARLLRLVLNYCELDVIELEKEIEFLTLYLELEQLRFGESLQYFIEMDPDTDLDAIFIPSFLIQPFIENSIWHGLLHKADNRKLWVRFSISESDDLLECVIEDNGIGREKSQELKANRTKSIEHQSKGMRLSADRLDLIKLKSPKGVNFSIHDLKDSKNNALGTKVTLSLPI